MISKSFVSLLLTVPLAFAANAATIIESWQMNDASGTQLSALTNDAGSASFAGDVPQVVTTGTGALEFTIGADAGDNVFRNAILTNPAQSTGDFEMQWKYLSATLAGGDLTGANVGFGMRDSSANADLFLVRLQRQNNRLLLQTRVGTTNANLDNFGSAITTIPEPLEVRVVAHLDAGTFDVFWKFESEAIEQSSTGIAVADPSPNPSLKFDQIRMVANTNTADWGATDSVKVDYLTVAFIPEPSMMSLLGLVWIGALLHRRR